MRLLLVGTLLSGFALRLVLLNTWPLREDEALYGYWARHFLRDPFFLSVFPDKPPLFIWIQAFALQLFGATSAGARVVSILASTVTIALVIAGARRIWHSSHTQRMWAGVGAGALIALNPFAIAFAATGYTDSLLVAFGTAALVLALRGRAFWAGVLLGAAIMTKQQGLLYAPLVVALVVLAVRKNDLTPGPSPKERGEVQTSPPAPLLKGRGGSLGWLTLGTLVVVAPILAWDASRWATAPSPWALGSQNYSALTLAAPDQWLARASEWFGLVWYGGASIWAWLLLALLGVALVWGWRHMRSRRAMSAVERWSPLLLALWILGFLAAHLFSTVQPWDRYLLPMWPVLAILLAGGVGWLAEWLLTPPANHNALVRLVAATGVALALLIQLPPAVSAARGDLPIGADHGDYAGLDEAARWVAARPDRAISVYHRALGWNLDFALYDAVQTGTVELRWYPNSVYLADNVTKNPARRSLVMEPDWAASGDLIQHATMRGLEAKEVARFGKVAIFEVAPASVVPCAWCQCSLPLWESLSAAPGDYSAVR